MKNRIIRIIGIPLDLGQSRRGVDMGPSAIRYAELSNALQRLGYSVEDAGNIPVPVREHLPESGGPVVYAEAIGKVCERVYDVANAALNDGFFPLFLGGDHSLAIGTIGGLTHRFATAVLWFDAHGDFNLPDTSPNGNIHGMPLAVLLGYGLPQLVNIGREGRKILPEDIIIIGTRDLDYDERTMLRESGIIIYTMREIDERGIGTVIREALERVAHAERIHVSFDMDVLDPVIAPGVGTPAPGGLTYREAHLAMEIIADSGKTQSMDVVEINPILDNRNQTAAHAVELITSLMGKRII